MPEDSLTCARERRTTNSHVALPIGDVAALTGLTLRAIRLYEEKGLLKPARDSNGMRWFDAEATGRIAFIAKAREAGFSLAEIKILAESAERPESDCREPGESMLARKMQALEVQRRALLCCCDMISRGASNNFHYCA